MLILPGRTRFVLQPVSLYVQLCMRQPECGCTLDSAEKNEWILNKTSASYGEP